MFLYSMIDDTLADLERERGTEVRRYLLLSLSLSLSLSRSALSP